MNLAFVDVGELGWSMYIAAHVRWYKEKTQEKVAVMTYPDRRCLYEGLADSVMDIPQSFYTAFDVRRQNCLGIQKVAPDILKGFLSPYLEDSYYVPDYFVMRCKHPFGSRLIFKPYKYSEKIHGASEILVFPRYRIGGWYSFRNLPEEFYTQLIERLCAMFPMLSVRTIGTANAAYDINVDRHNYINWVGRSKSLQDLIDWCQTAVAAVGSQSGPPKIALFQEVPTFIIGHQQHRHMVNENWSKTRVGFHSVSSSNYADINVSACVEEAVAFVKSNKRNI